MIKTVRRIWVLLTKDYDPEFEQTEQKLARIEKIIAEEAGDINGFLASLSKKGSL